MIVQEVTQEVLDKVWFLYNKVAKRHGRPPKIEDVLKDVEDTGAFVVRTGSEQAWTTMFVIREESNHYVIEVVPNTSYEGRYLETINQIVDDFNAQAQSLD